MFPHRGRRLLCFCSARYYAGWATLLWEGFKRLAPHDDGMSGGECLEAPQVVGKPVQQAVFKTDGTVACNSYDNGYHVGMVRGLYGNRTGNVRPRIIVFQCEVFELEVEDAFHVRIESHARQGTRFPGELQFHLFQMILIDMCVS